MENHQALPGTDAGLMVFLCLFIAVSIVEKIYKNNFQIVSNAVLEETLK